jgi:hypothetical protein
MRSSPVWRVATGCGRGPASKATHFLVLVPTEEQHQYRTTINEGGAFLLGIPSPIKLVGLELLLPSSKTKN